MAQGAKAQNRSSERREHEDLPRPNGSPENKAEITLL
jgi:hypothetical protein